jgi:nucleoside-diphosphate-sugar epimerase
MKVLITGAAGFIGQRLVARLQRDARALAASLEELVLVDLKAPHQERALARFARPAALKVRWLEGDITDAKVLEQAVRAGLDCVFHLASVPSGAAEANYPLGLRSNLDGTRMLLDAMRTLSRPPIFVFASSIAVFGVPMPELIDEDTYPAPSLSYGAQKWMAEILVGDCSRRGWIDGRAIRLPGVVARPPAPTGQISAFLSNLLRELSSGREFVCPVAAAGRSWWMSVECCIDNLVHAARMRIDPSWVRRMWMLPVLHASLGDVVAAIAAIYGPQVLLRIRYEPDAAVQAQFANYPPLHCPRSIAAGFRHDGDLATMIQRALHVDT